MQNGPKARAIAVVHQLNGCFASMLGLVFRRCPDRWRIFRTVFEISLQGFIAQHEPEPSRRRYIDGSLQIHFIKMNFLLDALAAFDRLVMQFAAHQPVIRHREYGSVFQKELGQVAPLLTIPVHRRLARRRRIISET